MDKYEAVVRDSTMWGGLGHSSSLQPSQHCEPPPQSASASCCPPSCCSQSPPALSAESPPHGTRTAQGSSCCQSAPRKPQPSAFVPACRPSCLRLFLSETVCCLALPSAVDWCGVCGLLCPLGPLCISGRNFPEAACSCE